MEKYSTINKSLKNALSSIVGRGNAFFDPETRICYSYDALNIPHLPDGVLFPRSGEEISRILKLANEHPFYVVPRGAGSGFSGGAVPVKGGMVISLSRWNRINCIDPGKRMAIVEPGVITGQFHREVEKRGLFYPPDPASLSFCTIGGNVAECAGGPRALKYGVTRDYVEGLEVVMPTGEMVFVSKNREDRGLMDLLIGSEGTLGIITRIQLRLIPLPESKATMLLIFSEWESASELVAELLSERILPSTVEFIDSQALKSVENCLGKEFTKNTEAMLIIEVDGDKSSVEAQIERMRLYVRKRGMLSFRIAKNRAEEEDIWRARRAISPSLFRLKPNKINEDVVVPIGRLPSMLRRIHDISKKYDIIIANFGHAGDGNIHVNILFDRKIPGEEERARMARDEVFHSVVEIGGTLSGEHGIGISKAPYLHLVLGDLGIRTLGAIKSAFDPKSILNPGKIITSEGLRMEEYKQQYKG